MDWRYLNIYNILLAFLSENKAEEAANHICDYLDNTDKYSIEFKEDINGILL